MKNLEETIFFIIAHSGEAKSCIMEAIELAKQNNSLEAHKKLEESVQYKQLAHAKHFELIQQEASGEQTPISLLLIHAEDQLMSVETLQLLAKEFINLYALVHSKI